MNNIENLKKAGLFEIFKAMYNNKYENAKELIKSNRNLMLFQDVNIMLPKTLRTFKFNTGMPILSVSYEEVRDLIEQEVNMEIAEKEQEELKNIVLTTTEGKKRGRL